jgi:2'-5' RNA ligase
MDKAQYFVAVIPNYPISGILYDMKEKMALNYGTKAALRSPAHITLHMPFKKEENKESLIADALSQAVSGFTPFQVQLKNYGCFPPKVLFIDVLKSDELAALQKSVARHTRQLLYQFNDTHRNRGFHPHITIAFRDLKKAAFIQAWENLQHESFEMEFTVNSIWLLKHNGTQWEAYKEFPFQLLT